MVAVIIVKSVSGEKLIALDWVQVTRQINVKSPTTSGKVHMRSLWLMLRRLRLVPSTRPERKDAGERCGDDVTLAVSCRPQWEIRMLTHSL